MAKFPEWAMDAARAALVSGPDPAESWGVINPPSDVVGEPRAYRIPVGAGFCIIDRWLVASAEKAGPQHAVRFIASEVCAYAGVIV